MEQLEFYPARYHRTGTFQELDDYTVGAFHVKAQNRRWERRLPAGDSRFLAD